MDGTIEPNEIHLTSEPVAEEPANGLNVLCVASDFKGVPFIRRAKETGNYVILLTREKFRHSAWGWAYIDELHCVPDNAKPEDYLRAATAIARHRRLDRICPHDEFDVLPCAEIRSHLQIEGQSIDSATRFRDKLTMRKVASEAGIPCPAFVGLFNPNDIVNFAETVAPEWIIKPRTEVAAFGIRKLAQYRRTLGKLARTRYARNLARSSVKLHYSKNLSKAKFITLIRLHLTEKSNLPASALYGTPPMKVTHEGGVSSTRISSVTNPPNVKPN